MLRLIAMSFTIRGVNTVIKMLQMAPEHPLRSPRCIKCPGRLAEGVRIWGPGQVTAPWETRQARTCHSLPSCKTLAGWPAARGPCWRETQVYPSQMSLPHREKHPCSETTGHFYRACLQDLPAHASDSLASRSCNPTSPSLQQAKQGMWCHRLLGTISRQN